MKKKALKNKLKKSRGYLRKGPSELARLFNSTESIAQEAIIEV